MIVKMAARRLIDVIIELNIRNICMVHSILLLSVIPGQAMQTCMLRFSVSQQVRRAGTCTLLHTEEKFEWLWTRIWDWRVIKASLSFSATGTRWLQTHARQKYCISYQTLHRILNLSLQYASYRPKIYEMFLPPYVRHFHGSRATHAMVALWFGHVMTGKWPGMI